MSSLNVQSYTTETAAVKFFKFPTNLSIFGAAFCCWANLDCPIKTAAMGEGENEQKQGQTVHWSDAIDKWRKGTDGQSKY